MIKSFSFSNTPSIGSIIATLGSVAAAEMKTDFTAGAKEGRREEGGGRKEGGGRSAAAEVAPHLSSSQGYKERGEEFLFLSIFYDLISVF